MTTSETLSDMNPADRSLDPVAAFVERVRAFLDLKVMPATTLGLEACNDRSLIDDVLNHGREPSWRTMRKVDAVMRRVTADAARAPASLPPADPPSPDPIAA